MEERHATVDGDRLWILRGGRTGEPQQGGRDDEGSNHSPSAHMYLQKQTERAC
jgi:hypothetical protein